MQGGINGRGWWSGREGHAMLSGQENSLHWKERTKLWVLLLNWSCMTGPNLVTLAPAFGFLTRLVHPSSCRELRHPGNVPWAGQTPPRGLKKSVTDHRLLTS